MEGFRKKSLGHESKREAASATAGTVDTGPRAVPLMQLLLPGGTNRCRVRASLPAAIALIPLVPHLQSGRRCNKVLGAMDSHWLRGPGDDTGSFAGAVEYVSVEAIGGSR